MAGQALALIVFLGLVAAGVLLLFAGIDEGS